MNDLEAAAIARAIAAGGGLSGPVTVVPLTTSTNDDARAAAGTGAPDGAAFLADAQTAGRGRGGHSWHSPPGENIHLSLLFRPRITSTNIAQVTLAVGVAVADVLAGKVGARATLGVKWPNDVLADGRKLAGVLVEGQLRGTAISSLIVGVGVNVHAPAFPSALADRATSLALLGVKDRDRSALAAALIVGISCAIRRFEEQGLAGFLAAITRRDVLFGQVVDVGGIRGTASGIDAEGRLLVRGDDGGTTAIVSGEVLYVESACATPASRGKLPPPP